MADLRFITGIIIGLVMLITGVIIAFTVVQNLSNINSSIDPGTTVGTAVTNETGFVNATGYTLNKATYTGFVPTITAIWNTTNASAPNIFGAGNATVSAAGVVTNNTAAVATVALISYTWTYKGTQTATERLQTNFTSGIDNVSSKIPTILTIVAVVVIMAIIFLLWQYYNRMDIGDGSVL